MTTESLPTINTESIPTNEVKSPRNATTSGERPYVYLCSPAHSGSTLIACLAAAHPDISTVGEFAGIFKSTSRCSCGRMYRDCDYWQKWIRLAGEHGIRFVPGDARRWVGARSGDSRWDALFEHYFRWRTVDRVRDVMFHYSARQKVARMLIDESERLSQILCDHEGTTAFFDTSKDIARLRHLLNQRRMPLKVVAMVRDGRGTVNSWMKWYGRSIEQAVDEWLWCIRCMRRALRYVPSDRVFHLRYEDLARDPTTFLPRLFAFCGAECNAPLDFSIEKRHIAGNDMRHTFDGTIRNEESWRTKLSPNELEHFRIRAGAVNRSLGYRD